MLLLYICINKHSTITEPNDMLSKFKCELISNCFNHRFNIFR